MNERMVCHADGCTCDNAFHKNATIIESPDGDLVAAWLAGGVGEGNCDQNVYGSRLPDEEDEWEDAECWVDVEDRAVGCPVLFYCPDNKLWMTAPVMYGNWLMSLKLFFKRPSDDGQTWKDLELFHERTPNRIWYGFERPTEASTPARSKLSTTTVTESRGERSGLRHSVLLPCTSRTTGETRSKGRW